MADLQSHNEVYEIHRQTARRKMVDEMVSITRQSRERVERMVEHVEGQVFARATSKDNYHR